MKDGEEGRVVPEEKEGTRYMDPEALKGMMPEGEPPYGEHSDFPTVAGPFPVDRRAVRGRATVPGLTSIMRKLEGEARDAAPVAPPTSLAEQALVQVQDPSGVVLAGPWPFLLFVLPDLGTAGEGPVGRWREVMGRAMGLVEVMGVDASVVVWRPLLETGDARSLAPWRRVLVTWGDMLDMNLEDIAAELRK